MNKEIYLIGGLAAESYPVFRERILATATVVSQTMHPEKMWVTLTETPPPLVSIIPFRKNKMAAISVITKETGGEDGIPLLIGMDGFRGATRVDEAIPVSYSKSWKNGTVTPGVCLLTLFRPKKGISQETFIDRWHNSHTPLSLRIHPLWHYNRNVVSAMIASGEPAWGGIVEEHFRSRADLLNPFLFFGSPWVIVQHMIEVYRDTKAFIDYPSMETYLVREYHM